MYVKLLFLALLCIQNTHVLLSIPTTRYHRIVFFSCVLIHVLDIRGITLSMVVFNKDCTVDRKPLVTK